MCLYVPNGGDIETCKADLVVYKILTIDNLSPWYEFAYRPNVLVRHRKALVFDICYGLDVIYGGFHAFLTKAQAVHCFAAFQQAAPDRSYKVVEMVIPKGAKMVRGVVDEVVSTSLRTGSLRALSLSSDSVMVHDR